MANNNLAMQYLREEKDKVNTEYKELQFNERCHEHTEMKYKLFNIMHIARKYGFEEDASVKVYEKKLVDTIKRADNNTKLREVEQILGYYLEYLIDLMYNLD